MTATNEIKGRTWGAPHKSPLAPLGNQQLEGRKQGKELSPKNVLSNSDLKGVFVSDVFFSGNEKNKDIIVFVYHSYFSAASVEKEIQFHCWIYWFSVARPVRCQQREAAVGVEDPW